MGNCTSDLSKKVSISTQTDEREIVKNQYTREQIQNYVVQKPIQNPLSNNEPVQGIPIPQNPNSKFIIFDFDNRKKYFDNGKKYFVGAFSKDITTQYIYEYIKKKLLEQNLIKPNNDIEIINFCGKNIKYSHRTINEMFEKNKTDQNYVKNCGLTKEQQEMIMKLKIVVTNIAKTRQCREDPKIILSKYNILHQLFCKSLTGEIITCQYNPEMTVEELKILIQEKKGISPDDHRLIFAGIQLEESQKLSVYKIQPESTINIVLHLCGGMFVEITSGNIDYKNIKDCPVDFNFDIGF
jgi:hypothetical protein